MDSGAVTGARKVRLSIGDGAHSAAGGLCQGRLFYTARKRKRLRRKRFAKRNCGSIHAGKRMRPLAKRSQQRRFPRRTGIVECGREVVAMAYYRVHFRKNRNRCSQSSGLCGCSPRKWTFFMTSTSALRRPRRGPCEVMNSWRPSGKSVGTASCLGQRLNSATPTPRERARRSSTSKDGLSLPPLSSCQRYARETPEASASWPVLQLLASLRWIIFSPSRIASLSTGAFQGAYVFRRISSPAYKKRISCDYCAWFVMATRPAAIPWPAMSLALERMSHPFF